MNPEKGNEWDDEWQSFTQRKRLRIIEAGLQEFVGRESRPGKSVIIVGAGMAGLVAAHELKKMGLTVKILEARQSVGGRIRTIREPYFSEGLYAEAGAMRIPESHRLTMEYVTNAGTNDRGVEPLWRYEFKNDDDNAWCYFNGKKLTWNQYEAQAKNREDCFKFNLTRSEASKTMGQKFKDEVIKPLRQMIETREDNPKALNDLMYELREYSTRRYLAAKYIEVRNKVILKEGSTIPFASASSELKLPPGWSTDVINAYGIIENQQARLNNGIVALVREHLAGSFSDDRIYQIYGGTDLLPKSFLPYLSDNIIFGAKVNGLKKERNKARVYYTTVSNQQKSITADYAIITLPFPMLRHIIFENPFSTPLRNEKQIAIQGLNYSAAGKILFQCRRRFWEDEDIQGGRSQTDLGIRAVWYPTKPPKKLLKQLKKKLPKRATLLASYTWGRDSHRWTHLSHQDRMQYAIKELAKIHPILNRRPWLIEGGYSIMWQNEEFSGGAFALTNPYQEAHDKACRQIDGRFHFAGEHTSLNYHRWIEGAVESGLRAAWEVYQSP